MKRLFCVFSTRTASAVSRVPLHGRALSLRLKITFKWTYGQTFSTIFKPFLHTSRIFGRIHARSREMLRNCHTDAETVP